MIIFDVGDLVWCLECMLLFLLVCTSRVILYPHSSTLADLPIFAVKKSSAVIDFSYM